MYNLREGFVNLREGFVEAPWRLREAFSKTRSAKASRRRPGRLQLGASAGRPHHFLQISDSNLLVLWLHILVVPLASCVYIHT